MKKTILMICIIMAVVSISTIEAQKPIKPLSEFQKDTLAYLEYNYGEDNTEILKGKTIKIFFNNSDVEYTTFKFTYDKENRIDGVMLLLQPYLYVVSKHVGWEVSGVWLFFSPALTNDNFPEIFEKFDPKRSGFFPLTPQNKALLENIIISENGIVIMGRTTSY